MDWLNDERGLADTEEEKLNLVKLFDKAVQDYLCKRKNPSHFSAIVTIRFIYPRLITEFLTDWDVLDRFNSCLILFHVI